MPLTRLSNNIHFTNQTQMPLSWGVSSETSASQKVENTAPSEACDVRVKSDPGTLSAGHVETGSLVLFQVVKLSGYTKGENTAAGAYMCLTEAIRFINVDMPSVVLVPLFSLSLVADRLTDSRNKDCGCVVLLMVA